MIPSPITYWSVSFRGRLSNMRLKLAGGDRFKGNGGRVARSLSAIR